HRSRCRHQGVRALPARPSETTGRPAGIVKIAYAVAPALAFDFLPFDSEPTSASTSSSHAPASSSSIAFAYMSSLARIFFAFTNICFSPVERPFSWSRSERFRTTSASSRMSPVFILSRLCLNLRFQFFGIWVPPPVSALRTTATMSSSITFRRPTFSAFSYGTLTVRPLWRILIVRYSRFWPSTSRCSFFTTVPAPWCGYTTLSPTLYKPPPQDRRVLSRRRRRVARAAGKSRQYSEHHAKRPAFPGISLEIPGNADLDREVAVDQVVLLEAAEALADLAGPDGAHALHLLQVALRGADDRVEPVHRRDDAPDHALREPRDVRE